MLVLVVRHAQAGSRDDWQEDDALRPLTERGAAQARYLVDVLAPYDPRRLVSSPLLRCVQTVQPLAARTGRSIETVGALGPTADERAVAFVRGLAVEDGPMVVCTHGEIIEALKRHLDCDPASGFVPGGAHEKGSVWVLEMGAVGVMSAEYLPPLSLGGQLTPSAAER